MECAFPGAIIALLLTSFSRLAQLPIHHSCTRIYTPDQASKALEFVNISFSCLSENRNNKSVSYPFPCHRRSPRRYCTGSEGSEKLVLPTGD